MKLLRYSPVQLSYSCQWGGAQKTQITKNNVVVVSKMWQFCLMTISFWQQISLPMVVEKSIPHPLCTFLHADGGKRAMLSLGLSDVLPFWGERFLVGSCLSLGGTSLPVSVCSWAFICSSWWKENDSDLSCLFCGLLKWPNLRRLGDEAILIMNLQAGTPKLLVTYENGVMGLFLLKGSYLDLCNQMTWCFTEFFCVCLLSFHPFLSPSSPFLAHQSQQFSVLLNIFKVDSIYFFLSHISGSKQFQWLN